MPSPDFSICCPSAAATRPEMAPRWPWKSARHAQDGPWRAPRRPQDAFQTEKCSGMRGQKACSRRSVVQICAYGACFFTLFPNIIVCCPAEAAKRPEMGPKWPWGVCPESSSRPQDGQKRPLKASWMPTLVQLVCPGKSKIVLPPKRGANFAYSSVFCILSPDFIVCCLSVIAT